jgi:hypothetical protein
VASAVVVEELRHDGIAQLPSAAVGLQDDTEIFETLSMVTGARPAEPGDSKLETKTSKTGLIGEPCLATGTC